MLFISACFKTRNWSGPLQQYNYLSISGAQVSLLSQKYLSYQEWSCNSNKQTNIKSTTSLCWTHKKKLSSIHQFVFYCCLRCLPWYFFSIGVWYFTTTMVTESDFGCQSVHTDCVRSAEWWGFLGTGTCDSPTGCFPPGQLSENRGSTDKRHLDHIKERWVTEGTYFNMPFSLWWFKPHAKPPHTHTHSKLYTARLYLWWDDTTACTQVRPSCVPGKGRGRRGCTRELLQATPAWFSLLLWHWRLCCPLVGRTPSSRLPPLLSQRTLHRCPPYPWQQSIHPHCHGSETLLSAETWKTHSESLMPKSRIIKLTHTFLIYSVWTNLGSNSEIIMSMWTSDLVIYRHKTTLECNGQYNIIWYCAILDYLSTSIVCYRKCSFLEPEQLASRHSTSHFNPMLFATCNHWL